MARARLLKPGFFMNSELGQMPPAARLLFQGLWCIADREGRLEDRPRRIKIEVLPYDKVNVERLLEALATGGFITRYQADGIVVIQITNFLKHQQPHFKEPASQLPPPPGHKDSEVVAFGIPSVQRERVLVRDGYRCRKCGAGDHLSIDHIQPRSKGGSGADSNLQTLCKRCNSAKGNRHSTAYDDPYMADGSSIEIAPCSPDPDPDPESLTLNPIPDPEAVAVPVRNHAAAAGPEWDLPSDFVDPDDPFIRCLRSWEGVAGLATAPVADAIRVALETYQEAWVLDAIRETGLNGKRSWNYGRAILERWGKEGRDDAPKPDDFESRKSRYVSTVQLTESGLAAKAERERAMGMVQG